MPNQTDILFLLHDIARQLRVDADRRARGHDMTRAQWVILWWVERQPGLSQKELAEIMDVEPITVARLVDRLTQRGMVERRDDPQDRRIWRLHLLPPALPVLAHMRGEREQVLEILQTGLAPETLELVAATLTRMKANIVGEMRSRLSDRATSTAPRALQPPARKTSGRTTDTISDPTFQQDHA